MTMQNWTDERLDNVISVFAKNLTEVSNSQVNLAESQAQQAMSHAEMAKFQAEQAKAQVQLTESHADLAKSHARHEEALVTLYESVRDIRQNLVELRAGQERQERILDYLIRQEGKNP